MPPLPESEWTDEQRAVVERYAPDGNPGNALRTLIRVPAQADRVFPFMGYIARDSTLSPRHRAMLILRTAWLTQSANLWATYASRAGESGLSAAEGSSRQGCNPAGASPAVSIAQVGHVAMPHPGMGNHPGDAWCKRPGRPARRCCGGCNLGA